MAEPFVILSLSGGGYCGLYTAAIIEKIEAERGGEPIHRAIDMFAGTSIGGIVALGLAHGVPASVIRAEIQTNGPDIFCDGGGFLKRKVSKAKASVRQLLFSKYPAEPLLAVVTRVLGDSSFANARRPSAISSLCVTSAKPYIFRNYDLDCPARLSRQVAMATSAAPTYFDPYWIGEQEYYRWGYSGE